MLMDYVDQKIPQVLAEKELGLHVADSSEFAVLNEKIDETDGKYKKSLVSIVRFQLLHLELLYWQTHLTLLLLC